MDISINRISIILETISFFLVTLDLFGRERLENLHKNTLSTLSKVKNKNIKNDIGILFNPSTEVKESNFTYGVLILLFLPISFIVVFYIMWDKVGWWILFAIIYSLLFAFLGGTFFGVFLHSFIVFLESVTDKIFSLIIQMLKGTKVEGVMIIFGTVLFLVSKIISFVYSR